MRYASAFGEGSLRTSTRFEGFFGQSYRRKGVFRWTSPDARRRKARDRACDDRLEGRLAIFGGLESIDDGKTVGWDCRDGGKKGRDCSGLYGQLVRYKGIV